jgi:hypothetical protein
MMFAKSVLVLLKFWNKTKRVFGPYDPNYGILRYSLFSIRKPHAKQIDHTYLNSEYTVNFDNLHVLLGHTVQI